MPSLLEIGLTNAVCAAALALVALAFGRVCKRPAVLHGLWLLVLLKLVTPPLYSLPLRVLPAEAPPVAVPAAPPIAAPRPAPTEESAVSGQFLLLPSPRDGELVVAIKLSTAADLPLPAAPEPAAPTFATAAADPVDWSWLPRLLGALWVAGMAVWFALSSLRMVRFQRLLRHAAPAPPALQARARALAERLGLNGCPEIALVPGSIPPMLWTALGRPRVYLPADLLERLETAEGDTLLAHELAHLRRHDHWVRWLEFLVQGIYWWYPLVPLVRRQVQANEEECCDALVVNLLPARTYACAIVRTLDFLAGARTLPAHASGLTRVAAMKRRLTRIMDGGVAGRLGFISRLGLASLAVAALPLLPTLARSTESDRRRVETSEIIDAGIDGEGAEELVADDAAAADSSTPRALAPSPDGKCLALALENHTIEIRDTATGHTVRTLTGHAGPVNCVAYSPDGKLLASGSSDRVVRLWDAATGQPRATLRGHGHWVYAVSFAPDGRTLASGSYDRTIRLWDAASGRCTATLRGHESAVRALAFAPDGQTLASGGGDRTLRLWDVPGRRLRATLTGHSETVRSVAFAPDGRTLASGSDDGTARLWEVGGTLRATLHGQSSEVTAVAFAPWAPVLVTGGMDRTLHLWDSASGRPLATMPGGRDGVIGLAFAAGDGSLTSLGSDRQVRRVATARVTMRTTVARAMGREVVMMPKPGSYRRVFMAGGDGEPPPQIIIVNVVPERVSN